VNLKHVQDGFGPTERSNSSTPGDSFGRMTLPRPMGARLQFWHARSALPLSLMALDQGSILHGLDELMHSHPAKIRAEYLAERMASPPPPVGARREAVVHECRIGHHSAGHQHRVIFILHGLPWAPRV